MYVLCMIKTLALEAWATFTAREMPYMRRLFALELVSERLLQPVSDGAPTYPMASNWPGVYAR